MTDIQKFGALIVPQANLAETRPDEAWVEHRHHWLQSDRDPSRVVAARWGEIAARPDQWEMPGDAGTLSPFELHMRGWRWMGPAHPPNAAVVDLAWVKADQSLHWDDKWQGETVKVGPEGHELREMPAGTDSLDWVPGSAGIHVSGFYSPEELRALADHMDRNPLPKTKLG